jgi:hypothetical protein
MIVIAIAASVLFGVSVWAQIDAIAEKKRLADLKRKRHYRYAENGIGLQ